MDATITGIADGVQPDWNPSVPVTSSSTVAKHTRVVQASGKFDGDGNIIGSTKLAEALSQTFGAPDSEKSRTMRTLQQEGLTGSPGDLQGPKSTFGRKSLRRAREEHEGMAQKEKETRRLQRQAKKSAERLKDLDYHTALAKASFKEMCYEPENNFGVESRVAFFEWLTADKKAGKKKGGKSNQKNSGHYLKAHLPDTIVWGLRSDGRPSWFFTAPDGTIRRTEKFTDDDVMGRIGNRSAMGALVAVVKRPATDRTGTDVDLMSTLELEDFLRSPGERKGLVCVQRFVKSKGPKATTFRTAWFAAHTQKAPKAWSLTNKLEYKDQPADGPLTRPEDRFVINPLKMHSCTVDEVKGVLCAEAGKQNDVVAKFLALERGINCEELIIDYIRDMNGRLWLLQVNAIVVRSISQPCVDFGLLPGETTRTQIIDRTVRRSSLKKTARPPERRRSSMASDFEAPNTKQSPSSGQLSPRCTVTGVKVLPGAKLKMSAADLIGLEDRRYRRGAKELHFVKSAALAAKASVHAGAVASTAGSLVGAEGSEAICQEAHDLLIAELRLERIQAELNKLMGMATVRCQLEDFVSLYGHTPAGFDDDRSSVATPRVSTSSDGQGRLPRDALCFRLLVSVGGLHALQGTQLGPWAADNLEAQVHISAMHQTTSMTLQVAGEGEAGASSRRPQVMCLYFYAREHEQGTWLANELLSVRLANSNGGPTVAGASLPLSVLLDQDASSPRKAALRTRLLVDGGEGGRPLPEAQVLLSLECLGNRRPKRHRPPVHHGGVWVPAPGSCTPDPLPAFWVSVLNGSVTVDEAVASWAQIPEGEPSFMFARQPGSEAAAEVSQANVADGALPDSQDKPGPEDPDTDADQELPGNAQADGEVQGHPVQELMGGLVGFLQSPDGDAFFAEVFEQVAEADGVVSADALGALLLRLLPEALPWERDLFEALVAVTSPAKLDLQDLKSAIKAAAYELDDPESADREMTELSAIVARSPPFQVRQIFVSSAPESSRGRLNFQQLSLFLQTILAGSPSHVVRQLLMQLALPGPDGTFAITFEEFRSACEAVPIMENTGELPAWAGGPNHQMGLPPLNVSGVLVVSLAVYTEPEAGIAGRQELPVETPMLLRVSGFLDPDALDPDIGCWQVGPIVRTQSGEFKMTAGDSEVVDCFLLDGMAIQPGEQLPSLEVQFLMADDEALLATSWCPPDHFAQLLADLDADGALSGLQEGGRGHCMELEVPLAPPGLDPRDLTSDQCGAALLLYEFIPQGLPDSASASERKEAEELRSARVTPREVEEWHEFVESSSPVAELLRSAGLQDFVHPMCSKLGVVRPQDLRDFDLGLDDLTGDRWEKLFQWLAKQDAMATQTEAQQLRSLVGSLPDLPRPDVESILDEMQMEEGRCMRSLEGVAGGRWISPQTISALAMGMTEVEWEDLALVEDKELHAELLTTGASPFDVRAVLQLAEDYRLAQLHQDEEMARAELAAEGFNPHGTRAIETIFEERTGDMEGEDEDHDEREEERDSRGHREEQAVEPTETSSRQTEEHLEPTYADYQDGSDGRSAYSNANTASETIPQLSHPSEGLYIDPYVQGTMLTGEPMSPMTHTSLHPESFLDSPRGNLTNMTSEPGGAGAAHQASSQGDECPGRWHSRDGLSEPPMHDDEGEGEDAGLLSGDIDPATGLPVEVHSHLRGDDPPRSVSSSATGASEAGGPLAAHPSSSSTASRRPEGVPELPLQGLGSDDRF